MDLGGGVFHLNVDGQRVTPHISTTGDWRLADVADAGDSRRGVYRRGFTHCSW